MKHCLLCFQNIQNHQNFYHWLSDRSLLCGDCLKEWQEVHASYHLNNFNVYVLYLYNDFLENLIFQYKEGQDVILAPVFFHECRRWIEQHYRGYTLLLMPSSKEKTEERGFHALSAMLQSVNLPKLRPFYKSENRKQSTLSFAERQKIGEILHLDETMELPEKLLLIDDVCTTGSTLNCAYQLLAQHTMRVQALVLCATPRFLEEHQRIGSCPCIRYKERRG